jgi:hypothetical protein
MLFSLTQLLSYDVAIAAGIVLVLTAVEPIQLIGAWSVARLWGRVLVWFETPRSKEARLIELACALAAAMGNGVVTLANRLSARTCGSVHDGAMNSGLPL